MHEMIEIDFGQLAMIYNYYKTAANLTSVTRRRREKANLIQKAISSLVNKLEQTCKLLCVFEMSDVYFYDRIADEPIMRRAIDKCSYF